MVNTNHEILGYLILPHSHLELSVHGSPQWLVRKSWKIHLQMDNLRVMTPCRSEKAGFSRKKLITKKTARQEESPEKKITLLRVIPTMTFIHFLTGKSSGILSDISSGILSGILSGKSSGILSGISSGILSGKSSGILSGISSGILSGILSGISSGILSARSYLLAFYLWQSIWYFIWHSIWHTFSHSIWHSILSGISSGILSGMRAVHTELGRSPVEVQRCTLRWANPRLRSSGAHWAGQVPGWGPAVHTELRRSLVEVPVHTELGSWQRAWRRELAKSLAKSWQGGSGGGSWCRHGRGETRRGGGGGQLAEEEEENSSDKI